MRIRAIAAEDVALVADIDGTVKSGRYLHVHRSGAGAALAWHLEERPLRSTVIQANVLDDQRRFLLKQIAAGIDHGLALVAEHDGRLTGLVLAEARAGRGAMEMVDLRVDGDYRRQGIGTALAFAVIQETKKRGLRAVVGRTRSNNLPAAQLMLKSGFDLAGIDTHFDSNHDLVKEAVTLFWCAALD